jgi:hypothetical protein
VFSDPFYYGRKVYQGPEIHRKLSAQYGKSVLPQRSV